MSVTPEERAIRLIEDTHRMFFDTQRAEIYKPYDRNVLNMVSYFLNEILRIAEAADTNANGVFKSLYKFEDISYLHYWKKVKEHVDSFYEKDEE